jgi:glycine/D-amino acid oxidase-like deaminating enzyme
LDIPVEILSKDEIKARAPILNVEDIEIGLFCEKDGIIDANALVHAYVSLAKMSGAVVETGVRATNIVIHGGKVVGVETTRGFVSAPVVINAAGIHAREVGAWIGLDLPLANALRHIVYNVPIPIVPEDMPMLEVLNPVVIYIASRGKRPDYTIGTFPTDSFEHKPNLELMLDKHLDDLIYRVPALAMAGVESVIAGIRCATQDFFPILGPVDEISGYFNNCGWGGYGITNGPVGGVLVAECIAGKSELDISIEHFVLKRFQKN